MKIGRFVCLSVMSIVCACGTVRVHATEPATQPAVPQSFMHFVDDGHGGGSLQTADVGFTNAAGVNVHLIAAVHIGEKSYYDNLNDDFKHYDAVLYELIKSKDAVLPAPGQPSQSDNPISDFQRFLKDSLELDFQLDDIDYTAPNFVHADLDKDTFERMQAERGESFESIMIRQILNSFSQPAPEPQQATPTTQPTPEESAKAALQIFTRPDMERQFKLVIAKQMDSMDATAMGLDGPGGSVILTERNKAAINVLKDTISRGKKNIAIFYGGAHMPDMSKRLEEMGFTPTSTNWNIAWDLTIRPNRPSAVEKAIDSFFDAIKNAD
jgi:hypothetical protein